MIEKLYASIILITSNFIEVDEYVRLLNSYFINDSENELLIDLEFASNDIEKINTVINRYINNNKINIDNDILEEILSKTIREKYNEKKYNIKDFAYKLEIVISMLPTSITNRGIFFSLNYACMDFEEFLNGQIEYYSEEEFICDIEMEFSDKI